MDATNDHLHGRCSCPCHVTRPDHAAYALFRAAGRPDTLWESLTEHEREGWRHMVLVVLRAYQEASREVA